MDNKMSYEEISALCLELSMLLRAGVMVGDALSLLAELSREEGELWEKPPEKQEGKGPLEFTALMQRLREKK